MCTRCEPLQMSIEGDLRHERGQWLICAACFAMLTVRVLCVSSDRSRTG